MTRALDSVIISHVDDPVIYPAWFFKGVFGLTTLRLWTGTGSLPVGSEIYLGNGWFQDFDPSAETEQLSAEGFNVTLTGIPQEILALVLARSAQNSRGYLYFTLLDEKGQLLAPPYLKSSGGLDVPEIEDSPKDSSVKLSYENSLLMLERANGGRYTDQSQKSRFPNDRFFEYVAGIQDLRFTWGKQTTDLNSA